MSYGIEYSVESSKTTAMLRENTRVLGIEIKYQFRRGNKVISNKALPYCEALSYTQKRY